jgi:S1-C subfamily serine protease
MNRILISFAVLTLASASAETATTAAPSTEAKPEAASVGDSILRVNITAQNYNFYQPWEKGKPGTRRGLGVLLDNGQVLVSAQMVSDATYVELEQPKTGEKVPGKISVVDYEANLALIEISQEKPEFLEEVTRLTLDTSPNVGDELDVWQVKDNGLAVSTRCPLLEVSIDNYFLSSTPFLTYELKGSLRYHAGSFVLPVMKGNKLAGLLLSYDSEEQISTVIAAPIIDHFLKDLEDGDYSGFPTLGMAFSRATDEQLRNYLELGDETGGIYVTTVSPNSTAARAGIEVGDVLLEIGGHPIDARGNYEHPDYGRLNMSHIVRGDSHIGQEMPVKIFRDGESKELTATMTRRAPEDHLVDPYLFDKGPRFFIAGGVVFQELTRPYLKIFGDQWRQRAPMKLLWALTHPEDYEKEGREKVVFISRVMRTPATLGYESVSHVIVDEVNGKEIKNLQDVADAFGAPEGPVHRIDIAEAPHELILDARMTAAMDERLKQAFRMRELQRLD